MKTTTKFLASIAFSVFFTSCQQEEIIPENTVDNGNSITNGDVRQPQTARMDVEQNNGVEIYEAKKASKASGHISKGNFARKDLL